MSDHEFDVVFRLMGSMETETATIQEIADIASVMVAASESLTEYREIAELREIVSKVTEPSPTFYSGT